MATLGEDMIVEWNWNDKSRQGQSMNIKQTDDLEFGLEPMYID